MASSPSGPRSLQLLLLKPSRSVFALGQMDGFNLFDGPGNIVFFGYFHESEPQEIGVRVRFLLQNIEIAYTRIQAGEDAVQREQAQKIIDQLAIEVLIPEKCDKDRLAAKISEFQPSARQIPLALHKPSDIERVVREEYEKMSL